MPLTSRVQVTLTGTLLSSPDFADVSFPLALLRAIDLANGAGAGQANFLWADQRTIAPSGTDALDLVGGGLVDALGAVVAPARLRALLIYSAPGNLNNLTVLGNAAAVPFLNTVATTHTLVPGGILLLTKPDATGFVVTATTGDIIQIVNAAGVNSVTYDIAIIGSNT
jgi:hypothetical protein